MLGLNRRRKRTMSQQQPDTSRRILIRAAIGGGSAALLLRIAPANAAEKMTRAQAEYQDTPNGIYSCGTCTLFVQPNGCKVVEGEVSKDGWCKAYAMAD
jgi:High potential iron-sulfur protein